MSECKNVKFVGQVDHSK